MKRQRVAFVASIIAAGVVLAGCATEPEPQPIEPASVVMPELTLASFQLLPDAEIESDPEWETTKLRIHVRKLDNSMLNALSLDVQFGGVVKCAVYRSPNVYFSGGQAKALFEGDAGYQELRCAPYTTASELAAMGVPTVVERVE